MCKCEIKKVFVADIDNFISLYDFGCNDEFVNSLNGLNRKGFLFQCPSCGEFEYIDENTYDVNHEIENVISEFSKEDKKFFNMTRIEDDWTKDLIELNSELFGFLGSNGQLLSNYKLNNDTIFVYQLRDTFTNENIIFEYVKHDMNYLPKEFNEFELYRLTA